MNLVNGVYFDASAIKNARKKEESSNRVNTLKNVALIATAPLAAKQVANIVDPSVTKAIVDTAANGIRGIKNFGGKSLQSVFHTKLGRKFVGMMGDLCHRFSNSKIYKALDNWGRSSKFWQKNVHDTGIKVIEEMRTNKGLVKYTALGLLSFAAYKTIKNHFEKQGAIKEKYNC